MTGLSTTNVWVLTDSKAGHKNQCLGLASALGVELGCETFEPRVSMVEATAPVVVLIRCVPPIRMAASYSRHGRTW